MGRLFRLNVVAIYDMGEQKDQPYIVQELVGCGDVEGLIEEAAGPLPDAQPALPELEGTRRRPPEGISLFSRRP